MSRSRRPDGGAQSEETFDGEILVSSSIVDQLSSGLYESPAACLKELVNNSFDADASTVHVSVKPDARRIIVEDDGSGITRAEFVRHFARISESHKRDKTDETPSGRPKIGKIGIGFIAANELCDTMVIESTTAGSAEHLEVTIDFAEMRRDPSKRRRGKEDLAKADYRGVTRDGPKDEHYTRLFLEDIRGEASDVLAGASPIPRATGGRSLYGLSAESIVAALRDGNLKTWAQLDRYSSTMLEVALNVPVTYAPGWVPEDAQPALKTFEDAVKRLAFEVVYDGTSLRKPAVFFPDVAHLVHTFSVNGSAVGVKGYFFAQHGSLQPRELNGVLVRIRNAAVGGYRRDFLGFPLSTSQLVQGWISGEVWGDDRLEEALNIDRQTLRTTHPAYVELQKIVHDQLAEVLARARVELYEARSQRRRAAEARSELTSLATVVEASRDAGPLLAKDVVEAWQDTPRRSGERQPPVLRKYTVAEVYQVVLDVAREFMSPGEFRKFVSELTRRLTS